MGSIEMPRLDSAMSDSSSSPAASNHELQHEGHGQTQKRTADAAGLKPNGMRPAKSVKRRASKACQCCRARKVRCNVVEHGAPCTNCRLDEVECIVSESKRKKKWTSDDSATGTQSKPKFPSASSTFPTSARPPYEPLKSTGEHVPHTLYQDLSKEVSPVSPAHGRSTSLYSPDMLLNLQRLGQRANSMPQPPIASMVSSLVSPVMPTATLPLYIKPLPARFSNDDIMYLEKRGALTIPDRELRDELLRAFVELCYPFMPLVNMHEIVSIIDANNGKRTISLLLFQAIMFAGVASVEMRSLKAAGYATRKDARRDYFQRVRLLYDFDYEADRITLIQSLLIMTYWYETPDDQKDSHHWMGIAVSLAHTIGLHRNPDNSNMDDSRKKLWKRMWWSTYMRDRLIALGMRRPTRIKDSDFDVPMLTVDDFEDSVLHNRPSCIPADSKLLRSAEMQEKLAIMCIEKAKLCICVSHVLSVQYSVLHNNHGVTSEEGSTRTTMMLVAKKFEPEVDEVQTCDKELQEWKENLDSDVEYVAPTWHDVDSGNEAIVLNMSLLHMVYYAALSALHRPQVLPSTALPPRATQSEALEVSRKAVRLAAGEITSIANNLYNLDLVRLLPTTGITVLLPAIIIHLLDIKAPDEATRRASLQGFCQCMQIMAKLRDIYAAADYSTAFLEAAIRKAEITLPQKSNEVKEPRNVITSAQGLVDAGKRLQLVGSVPGSKALTPPPEDPLLATASEQLSDEEIGRRLNNFLASTPPDSEGHNGSETHDLSMDMEMNNCDMDFDFDSLINMDGAGDMFSIDDETFAHAMQDGAAGVSGFNIESLHGANTDNSHELLSPPPEIAHDDTVEVAHRSQSSQSVQSRSQHTEASSGHESNSQQSQPIISPDIARFFTHLRTPARLQHAHSDSSSNYYTAAWGSPYQLSPSPSAHTAVSVQAQSDELPDFSPGPAISLDHLVPSQFAKLQLPQPERSSQTRRGTLREGLEDEEHTPRSRTKRWVQLPQRPGSQDKLHWWSDGSDHEHEYSKRARRLSSPSRPRPANLKSHKGREENRTLNQRDFWETLRERRVEDGMEGLKASKWAATPPPQENVNPSQADAGMLLSKVDFTVPPGGSQDINAPDLTQLKEQAYSAPSEQGQKTDPEREADAAAANVSNIVSKIAHSGEGQDTLQQMEGSSFQGATMKQSLGPPRLKKKFSFRGKNIVVSIPLLDYAALGVQPLEPDELQFRSLLIEQDRHDSMTLEEDGETSGHMAGMAVRAIYPDEQEMHLEAIYEQSRVNLPDLRKWQAYMDALTEAKLAALGVSSGPSESGQQPAQDMSRQSSGHYPPLPFSPPLSTASAGSMGAPGRPAFIRGHSHTMSVASPVSPMPGPFAHLRRNSTFHGPSSFFPQGAQQQQPPQGMIGVPGMQSFSPTRQFVPQELSRGASPAHMAGLRSDLGGLMGPGSPLSHHALPMSPQEYNRNPFDQSQRSSSLSRSIGSPSLPVLTPSANVLSSQMPQPQSFRPTPALPELQEDEEEEEEEMPQSATTYMPPHKRAHFNADIAIPSPKGHRHNISETLERDVLEKDWGDKSGLEHFSESEEEVSDGIESSEKVEQIKEPELQLEPPAVEKDPLAGESLVQETARMHRKTASRSLNAAAASFTFNPNASFTPATQNFTFNSAPMPQQSQHINIGHVRNTSSGSFNPSASVFKPLSSTSAAPSSFTFDSANVPQPSSFASGGASTRPNPPPMPFSFGAGSMMSQQAQPFAFGAQLPAGGLNHGPAQSPIAPALPRRDFSFTAELKKAEEEGPQSSEENSAPIFGKVHIPDIIKPSRRSKAVTITRPKEMISKSTSGTDAEDSEGRITQGTDRMKRSRFRTDDGDEVPQFAEPTPEPELAHITPEQSQGSNATEPQPGAVEAVKSPLDTEADEEPTIVPEKTADIEEAEVEQVLQRSQDKGLQEIHAEESMLLSTDNETCTAEQPQMLIRHSKHRTRSSLSALAAPFKMPLHAQDHDAAAGAAKEADDYESLSELEDGEIKEDSFSPSRSQNSLSQPPTTRLEVQGVGNPNALPRAEPSFDEIDAVMQHLNEADSVSSPPRRPPPASHSSDESEEPPVTIGEPFRWAMPRSERAISPSSERSHVRDGEEKVTTTTWDEVKPEIGRQVFPPVSVSPRKAQLNLPLYVDDQEASQTLASFPMANGWPHANRLNNPNDVPVSEWSDMLSTPEDAKLQTRSTFFDGHIERLIGKTIAEKLAPIEATLKRLTPRTEKRSSSRGSPFKQLAPSIVGSDADDEDDDSQVERSRPISRGRDKRLDQVKAIVVEALREQYPRPPYPDHDLADLHTALADMKVSFARATSSNLDLDDIKHVVEEAINRQSTAMIPFEPNENAQQHRRQLSQVKARLNDTLADALAEANARRAAEEREADTRRLLRLAEEEVSLLRDTYRDGDSRLQALEDERSQLIGRAERAEDARHNLQEERDELRERAQRTEESRRKLEDERDELNDRLDTAESDRRRLEDKINSLEAESDAIQATLEEYRRSSDKWRNEIDEDKRLQAEQDATIAELHKKITESQESGNGMRRRLEKLHADMSMAAGQLASEKALWRAREEEYRARCDTLEAQKAASIREYSVLGEEVRSLRSAALDAAELKVTLEHTRASNISLEEMRKKLQGDLIDLQAVAAKWEREFHDAKEAGHAEVQRVKMSLETDVESANHQVNIVRAELESELSGLRAELDNVRMKLVFDKARHDKLLQESEEQRREALKKTNHANSVALDEARQKHDASLKELAIKHSRSLEIALEDKKRSEAYLNERLTLSDEKVKHYKERAQHLEERLEVAQSAAQAAAKNAKSVQPTAAVSTSHNVLPEKVSPQALRESILVLQEQLQEREATIERLQTEAHQQSKEDKVRDRDTEITWLRELLDVRRDELSDLVNTLTRPNFDRAAVRNTAIRISTNLQMEQQEKERTAASGEQSLSGAAFTGLSSLATPQTARITSAFNSWRQSMESVNLRKTPSVPPRPGFRPRANTPSKVAPQASSSFLNGLMTPPASNLRKTPSPQQPASLPPPRLHSRQNSATTNRPKSAAERRSSQQTDLNAEMPASPSLFRRSTYDEDAEDSNDHVQSFEEDEDLDVADSQPPAFRSLESELEERPPQEDDALVPGEN